MHFMRFQEKLRRLIAYRNLTQEELGNALGIAQTTVGRWLAGKSIPYDRTAQRLADYFGIDDSVLLNDEFELPENSLVADFRGYKVTPELTKKIRRIREEYHVPTSQEIEALSHDDGSALAAELDRTAARLFEHAAAIRRRMVEFKKKGSSRLTGARRQFRASPLNDDFRTIAACLPIQRIRSPPAFGWPILPPPTHRSCQSR